jgi:MoaA/NifB/PqqE/SkfB family radical SAM enzyme
MTRACNLSCVHCYASATPGPAPDELTLEESRRLVESLTAYGVPVILFSGGEPMAHPTSSNWWSWPCPAAPGRSCRPTACSWAPGRRPA